MQPHWRFYAPSLLAGLLMLAGCEGSTAPLAPAIVSDVASGELASMQPTYTGDDYPAWRNVDQDGVEDQREVPVQWSADEGVVWSADVAGRGHSSPVICGDQVFLTTADEDEATQSVLAFDQASGAPLWTTTIHRGGLPAKHNKNSHASSTPVCDGQHLFVAFLHNAALHVTALDMDGVVAWQQEVGPFASEHGYGSSLVIWKGLLFASGDSRGGGYVAALDRRTGAIVWRTPRSGAGQHGNYTTPLVAELAGQPQLILAGFGRVVSYDPLTGKQHWTCNGAAEVMGNTPAYRDPLVIVSGGFPEKAIVCIEAGGSGDVTDTHVKWRASRNIAYVPSPTVVGDHLYVVTDGGVLACYAIGDGEMLWQERLGGAFTASPLVIGTRFYLPSEAGDVVVFDVDPEYRLLATNRLDDRGGMASMAVAGERLFLRTAHKLYCLGHP